MIASQSGMIINPIVNKNMSYDTERDFVAITQVTSSPLVVAVHPSLPAKSIRELIAEARKNPGKLNFATSGNGSLPHLATALFDALAGVEMVHIPYKSGRLSVPSAVARVIRETGMKVDWAAQALRVAKIRITSSTSPTPRLQPISFFSTGSSGSTGILRISSPTLGCSIFRPSV